jgi:hypothetical protein
VWERIKGFAYHACPKFTLIPRSYRFLREFRPFRGNRGDINIPSDSHYTSPSTLLPKIQQAARPPAKWFSMSTKTAAFSQQASTGGMRFRFADTKLQIMQSAWGKRIRVRHGAAHTSKRSGRCKSQGNRRCACTRQTGWLFHFTRTQRLLRRSRYRQDSSSRVNQGIRGRVEMVFAEDDPAGDTSCCQNPRWGSAQ